MNDFTEHQRIATAALARTIIIISTEVANEEKSAGVAMNALISAYTNYALKNGLKESAIQGLRMAADILETDKLGLLSRPVGGQA